MEAIVEAIRSDQEQRVKIAESQEEKLIDESVNVYISEDAMEAYIELLPADGKNLTAEDIITGCMKKELYTASTRPELKNYA